MTPAFAVDVNFFQRRHLAATTNTEVALYVVIVCLCVVLLVVLCLRKQHQEKVEDESRYRSRVLSDTTDIEENARSSWSDSEEHLRKNRRRADQYSNKMAAASSSWTTCTRSESSTVEQSSRPTDGYRTLKLWEAGEMARNGDSASYHKFERYTEQASSSVASRTLEKLIRDNDKLREEKKHLEEELTNSQHRFSYERGRESYPPTTSPRTPSASCNFGEASPVSLRQREVLMRLLKRVVSETQVNKNLEDELARKSQSLQQLQKQVDELAATSASPLQDNSVAPPYELPKRMEPTPARSQSTTSYQLPSMPPPPRPPIGRPEHSPHAPNILPVSSSIAHPSQSISYKAYPAMGRNGSQKCLQGSAGQESRATSAISTSARRAPVQRAISASRPKASSPKYKMYGGSPDPYRKFR